MPVSKAPAAKLLKARAELRKLAGVYAEGITDQALNELLKKCSDPELAATALTMKPRPRWVLEIVGDWG